MNSLKIYFRSSNVNGYPTVRILLNSQCLKDFQFTQDLEVFEILLDSNLPVYSKLEIERYGKTKINSLPHQDQTLEIIKITVDDSCIPDYVIREFSVFKFNHESHLGSTFFSPNGLWTFNFKNPIISWILDCKILHESKYNQDYLFPWSYKLGPNSVDEILTRIAESQKKVDQLL